MSHIFGNSPRWKETKELVICTNHTSPAEIICIDPCPSPLSLSLTHTPLPDVYIEKEKYKRKNGNDGGQVKMTQISEKDS